MARPKKHVDLIEVIGRRWAGESFPVIARRMRLGRGTVHRAYRSAIAALQAAQNPKPPRLRTVTEDAETLESWLYSQISIAVHSAQQTQNSRLRMPFMLLSRCQVSLLASIPRKY